MKDIDWQLIQSFVAACKSCPKTRKNLVFTLRLMWKSARAGGWVSHNPFEDLRLPRVNAPREFFYTAEQAKLIIANAEGQYKTLYWIAAETGMRAGELAGLRIDDIGLDDMTIRVNQSAWEGKLQEPKTKNAKRSIAVTPELTDHIRTFLSGWKPNSRNLLFTSPRGKALRPNAVRRYHLGPLCDRLQIKTKGLKAFRHCHATMMDQAGVPLKVRQERLGHALGSTVTMVHYTHAVSADHRSAARTVGEMLN